MEGDISQLLRQFMEDPQFGNMVQNVKEQLGGKEADLSQILGKMPELLSALAPMLEKPAGEETPPEQTAADSGERKDSAAGGESAAETGAEPMPVMPPVLQTFFRPGSREKRNCLLAALKPYLSPARCMLIDRAMSAMQMGELLGTVMPREDRR